MDPLNFDGGRNLTTRLCQKEKRCFFLCDYANGEISQKKKKKISARGTTKKINTEKVAVEKFVLEKMAHPRPLSKINVASRKLVNLGQFQVIKLNS